ncbi:hypothetical protein BGZ91_004595 [Linnemannia elongata]|nr:hypothetical protein BGZ91_004595 [Linnemannia elongata]KAG0048015.1 hypothetical protein BGZ90_007729 [Linnemannia elongata]
MSSFTMTIYVMLDGDAPLDAFPIVIESTKTISHLKKLIKNQRSHVLCDIDAQKLNLWQVLILIPFAPGGREREPVWYDVNDNAALLKPSQKVESVFTIEPHGTKVQVLVQRG